MSNVPENLVYTAEHEYVARTGDRYLCLLRLDRARQADFPVWLFSADDLTFDLTVLPHDVLRQAPLSGIDERPMRRATATQLRALMADAEIAGYEGP